MKIFRVFCLPLLGAIIITAACKTEETKQSGAAPPSDGLAPTLTEPTAPAPQPQSQQTLPPKPDPVPDLVKLVEDEYAKGEANYRTGHLEAARENFDRAFDILLTGPVGVHSDDRLEREFDKIVESVNRLEMLALKEGDGFTGQRSEPAPIDEANEVTFPIDPAVRAKAEAELRQTRSDLPLVMNDQVASFVNYFSAGKGRGAMEHGLVRAGRFHDMISRVLREEGVPQDLIYLAQAESGFHPLALSRAGARGMWQFMAGRASGYGLQRNWWVDERQDPEKATRAAARHLKDLYNQFGDWYLAMAAYNSGPGTVQRAVERTGYADFWELYRRNVLPKETRNYVPIILAVTIMTKNLSHYGFDDVSMDEPVAFDSVTVNYPVDLRLVADCVDATSAQLQQMNPSLLRLSTPKEGTFELHLPAGTKQQYQTAIADIPAGMRLWWRYPRVHSGDTLASLARAYRTTAKSIAEANHLDGTELQTDAKLIVPVAPSKHSVSDTASYAHRITRYKVRKGDTVQTVAENFGVSVQMIRRWNGLRGDSLHGRTVLALHLPVTPTGEPSSTASSKPASHSRKGAQTASAKVPAAKSAKPSDEDVSEQASVLHHKVKSGETFYSIATTYKTTVAALKRNNQNVATLRPGMILVVQQSQ